MYLLFRFGLVYLLIRFGLVYFCLGLVWCILFSQLIYNTPEEHPRISSGELLYLEKVNLLKKQQGAKTVKTT